MLNIVHKLVGSAKGNMHPGDVGGCAADQLSFRHNIYPKKWKAAIVAHALAMEVFLFQRNKLVFWLMYVTSC